VRFQQVNTNSSRNEQGNPTLKNLRKRIKVINYLNLRSRILHKAPDSISSCIIRAAKGYPDPDNCNNQQSDFLSFVHNDNVPILG